MIKENLEDLNKIIVLSEINMYYYYVKINVKFM